MPDPEDFYRIRRLPPYVFEEVNRLKATLRASGAGFSEHGEGFVRIGLDENEQRIQQAARGVRKMLSRRNAA